MAIQENTSNQLPHLLERGKLTPDFQLTDTISGKVFTREQFRGKQGLVLIFCVELGRIDAFLDGVQRDLPEYRELGAQVLTICQMPSANSYDFPILVDSERRVWAKYTGVINYGYAAFVLDTYGALEVQYLVAEPELLPDPADVREWCRGAQYRCSA